MSTAEKGAASTSERRCGRSMASLPNASLNFASGASSEDEASTLPCTWNKVGPFYILVVCMQISLIHQACSKL